MRIGVTILPEYTWAEAQARWRGAEEIGFDDAWTFDHLGIGELLDAPWYGALPTLAAAAAVTTRIRIGTLVSTPNFRHPLSFARDLIALDSISSGRFTCGLGSGSPGYDSRVFGTRGRVAHRGRRFGEFVELLDLLLRQDRVTWHGEFYEVAEARPVPGCVQQPRLPFVVAANAVPPRMSRDPGFDLESYAAVLATIFKRATQPERATPEPPTEALAEQSNP